jgi:hypothetical protein
MNNYNNDETKVVYDNKCIITQEEKMLDVEGEILEYKHKDYMKVVIGKSVALKLFYDQSCDRYIGEKSKMPFVTKGPDRLK